MFRWGWLAALVAGCEGPTTPTGPPTSTGTPTDADRDGVPAADDCDDLDPAVHPGADERCDGVDQDCDGAIDDDAVDAPAWYADGDGDGWGAGAPTRSCAVDGAAPRDGDCDDASALTRPDARDVPNDGVDSDCAGGDATERACVAPFHGDRSFTGADAAVAIRAFLADHDAVDGTLTVEGTDLATLSIFDGLCAVGGLTLVDNPSLAGVDPIDAALTGDLVVHDNPALTTLSWRGSGSDAGGVWVERNPARATVELTAFSVDRGVELRENGTAGLDLDVDLDVDFRSPGDLVIAANPGPTAVDLRLTGALRDLRLEDLPAIEVSFAAPPADPTGDVVVIGDQFDSGRILDLIGALGSVGGSVVLADTGIPAGFGGDTGVLGSIGGDLTLDVDQVVSLGFLDGLSTIGGDLTLLSGTDATWGAVLPALGAVGGDVRVIGVAVDPVERFLHDLGSVGGDLALIGTTWGRQDHALATVGGDLVAYDAGDAGQIAFAALGSVGGGIDVLTDAALILPALGAVGGDVSFADTAGPLGGLDLGTAELPGDLALDRVDLGGARVGGRSIGGDLAVSACGTLAPAAPWAVESIGGDLSIDASDTDLAWLGAVRTVGGRLSLADLTGVDDLRGLGGLEAVGALLAARTSVRSFSGLGPIPAVDLLAVEDNLGLTSLVGLDALTTAGELTVWGNDALPTLAGLDGLRSADWVSIAYNDALTDVLALDGLETVGDLYVFDNPALPTSNAEALAAAIDTVTGTVTISGNGP
ncbi:MAG: putative metal-binding motif-containing protein [Myxococcota bacterium]